MKKMLGFLCVILLFLFSGVVFANPKLMPGEISAGDGFENHIPIHWAAHGGGTASSYRLYRKSDGEFYVNIENIDSDRIHTIDYNTDPGLQYTYKISAIIGGGEVDSINESSATCSDVGHTLDIRGYNTSAAVIDGVFNEAEWYDALEIDITNDTWVWTNPLEERTYAYVKYFEGTLYLAVKDYNDPTRDANDQLVLLFDFNNDNQWTADDHDGKFNLMWYEVVNQELSLYMEMTGAYPLYNFVADYYDPEFITTRIEEGDNCLVYETAIDLSNYIFDVDFDINSFGMMIQTLSYNANGVLSVSGMYPNNGIWAAPISFANTSVQFQETSGVDNRIINPMLALSNYPNPFNPSTTISFELDSDEISDAEIVIFDLKGQMIKRLAMSGLQKGTNQITWNGRDEKGNTVSSGVYLYRLVGQQMSSVQKMIMMK